MGSATTFLLRFITFYYLFSLFRFLTFCTFFMFLDVLLEEVRERRLETEGWRKKAGERRFEKVGESWRKLEKVGESMRKYETV